MRGFQELSIVVHSLLHFTYVFLVRLTHHPPVYTPYDISIARCQGSNKSSSESDVDSESEKDWSDHSEVGSEVQCG